MVDPKFMSVLFVVLVSSNSIKRSRLSYENKILISLAITFILSFFYYKGRLGGNGNWFFSICIFLIIIFLISCEKEGRTQAKEFFKNIMQRVRNHLSRKNIK